ASWTARRRAQKRRRHIESFAGSGKERPPSIESFSPPHPIPPKGERVLPKFQLRVYAARWPGRRPVAILACQPSTPLSQTRLFDVTTRLYVGRWEAHRLEAW